MVMGDLQQSCDVLVIGSGPGGYAAAFRAADLGLDVALVDPMPRPGGVCLFEGCIPSKSLLFLAELIHDARRAADWGLTFGPPEIDLAGIRRWKDQVIDDLAGGLVALSKRRGVQLLCGRAIFDSASSVRLQDGEVSRITFSHCVIAAGSRAISLPGVPVQEGGRIFNAAGALQLEDIPERLLVVGGGYVGLEIGTVYSALGSSVELVEISERLLPGVDRDLTEPLRRRLEQLFTSVSLGARIVSLAETETGVSAEIEQQGSVRRRSFDRALVAIGRIPNSEGLNLTQAGVATDGRGFIVVDEQQRTSTSHIYAVGDIAGGVMLAHKATREGRVAAEVIAGMVSAFDVRAIPSVVYTDPQIAWCGLTEEQAAQNGTPVTIHTFPWKYSGRANTMAATDGLTKILADPRDGRILGAGITGRHCEGMIAEAVLAIEMGALAEDMALSLHPHPSLSETEAEAAELFLGSATHLPPQTK